MKNLRGAFALRRFFVVGVDKFDFSRYSIKRVFERFVFI